MKMLIVLFAGMLLTTFAIADDIYLKDGSVVRGKLIEIKSNELYRIRTKDGSEFVYTMDKVDRVEFSKEEKHPSPTNNQPWGVIAGNGDFNSPTSTEWDNSADSFSVKKNYVQGASFGIGLGKYGAFGAELNFRPSDVFGVSLGLGAQYWYVSYSAYQYTSYGSGYYTSGEDSGFSAMVGGKLHFYFTPRNQPNQHNIFLAGYGCDAIGIAAGIAYGYEHHRESGAGWDFSIGLVAAPDVERCMAEQVGAGEDDVDITWIPILIELGYIF